MFSDKKKKKKTILSRLKKHTCYIVTNREISKGFTYKFGQKYIFYTSFQTLKYIEIMFRDVFERNRSFLHLKSMMV